MGKKKSQTADKALVLLTARCGSPGHPNPSFSRVLASHVAYGMATLFECRHSSCLLLLRQHTSRNIARPSAKLLWTFNGPMNFLYMPTYRLLYAYHEPALCFTRASRVDR
jgi:hypothetical protein